VGLWHNDRRLPKDWIRQVEESVLVSWERITFVLGPPRSGTSLVVGSIPKRARRGHSGARSWGPHTTYFEPNRYARPGFGCILENIRLVVLDLRA
jgi:hypothetical protein